MDGNSDFQQRFDFFPSCKSIGFFFRRKYWRKEEQKNDWRKEEQKNERKAKKKKGKQGDGKRKTYLCTSELNLLVVVFFCFEISNVSICSWLKREVDCFTLMWIPVIFSNMYQVLPAKKYNLHVGDWETQSPINIEWVHKNPGSSRIWSLFRLKAL